MRYGILSDIHANLESLQAVITALKSERIDLYLCPGDIVGYGADPQECTDLVKGLKAVTVAGNHDWAVVGQTDLEYFNPIAKAAALWTQKHLSTEAKEFLKNLPLFFQNEELAMVHAALPSPEAFDYLSSMSGAEEMFKVLERNICFIGHTHVPFIICQDKEGVQVKHTWKVKLEPENRYIINVGSVGQPRDGNPQAAYCVFDSDSRMLVIERVNYDIKKAQKKIIKAGLPVELASRLSVGL